MTWTVVRVDWLPDDLEIGKATLAGPEEVMQSRLYFVWEDHSGWSFSCHGFTQKPLWECQSMLIIINVSWCQVNLLFAFGFGIGVIFFPRAKEPVVQGVWHWRHFKENSGPYRYGQKFKYESMMPNLPSLLAYKGRLTKKPLLLEYFWEDNFVQYQLIQHDQSKQSTKQWGCHGQP